MGLGEPRPGAETALLTAKRWLTPVPEVSEQRPNGEAVPPASEQFPTWESSVAVDGPRPSGEVASPAAERRSALAASEVPELGLSVEVGSPAAERGPAPKATVGVDGPRSGVETASSRWPSPAAAEAVAQPQPGSIAIAILTNQQDNHWKSFGFQEQAMPRQFREII